MKLKNIKVGDYIEAKNNDDGMIEKGQLYKVFAIDTDDTVAVDATKAGGIWWVDPADFRRPRTKLKQLDQSVFDGLDKKWRFVAVDEDGMAFIYQSKPRLGSTYFIGGNGCDYVEFGTGYDASNWQNSLIERESKELTGSELCKAMLVRGDKYVMCGVSDVSDLDAASNEYDDLISDAVTDFDNKDGLFGTVSMRWSHAVPINNQGEPLTAAEEGL